MFFDFSSFFMFFFILLEFVTPDSRVRVVLSLRSGLVLSLVVRGGSRAIHNLPGEPGTRVLWMSCRDPRV